jgi:hypothetical protein
MAKPQIRPEPEWLPSIFDASITSIWNAFPLNISMAGQFNDVSKTHDNHICLPFM